MFCAQNNLHWFSPTGDFIFAKNTMYGSRELLIKPFLLKIKIGKGFFHKHHTNRQNKRTIV